MENKKRYFLKRGGCLAIATMLSAGSFPGFAKSETDLDQFNSVVNQKTKKVTGTVVDETGLPIIGANVVQKGTTNGIITDLNGYFTLKCLKELAFPTVVNLEGTTRNFENPKHYLFPIPQGEIVINGNLEQNSGYN